jgi:hypothetical protein
LLCTIATAFRITLPRISDCRDDNPRHKHQRSVAHRRPEPTTLDANAVESPDFTSGIPLPRLLVITPAIGTLSQIDPNISGDGQIWKKTVSRARSVGGAGMRMNRYPPSSAVEATRRDAAGPS